MTGVNVVRAQAIARASMVGIGPSSVVGAVARIGDPGAGREASWITARGNHCWG